MEQSKPRHYRAERLDTTKDILASLLINNRLNAASFNVLVRAAQVAYLVGPTTVTMDDLGENHDRLSLTLMPQDYYWLSGMIIGEINKREVLQNKKEE